MSKKHKNQLFDLNSVSDSDKPLGEDFFVFSLIFDDPFHPTWEFRQSVMGSWNQVINGARLIASGSGYSSGKLLWFQGAKARDYLLEMAKQESHFQQERKSTPNN